MIGMNRAGYVRVAWMPLGIVLAVAGIARGQALPPEVVRYADLVLYNGQVLVADDAFTIGQAVAVRDGKVIAVGPNDRIRAMAGPKGQQLDLRGATVVPGFYDTHLHVDNAYDADYNGPGIRYQPFKGMGGGKVDVTRDEYLAKLKALVESRPKGETILAYAPTAYCPITRAELDRIAPNNAVALRPGTGPGEEPVYVNSRALEMMSLPLDTPGLVKDANGQPTGQLNSFAAGKWEYETMPWVPVQARFNGLKRMMKLMNSLGVTMIATRSKPVPMSAIKRLWEQKALTVRWRLASEMIRMNQNAESVLKRVGDLDGLGDEMLKLWGVQPGNPDGTDHLTFAPPRNSQADNRPSALTADWDENGKNYWYDPKTSGRDLLLLANRYGWRTTMIHSAGDKANSLLLDAYAEADKENPIKGRRFAIDHCPMITPADMKKMVSLGVICSTYMAGSIGRDPSRLVDRFGADRVASFTAVRTMIDMGLKPVAESDSNPTPGNEKFTSPLWNMEHYVTRTDDASGRLWGPNEKITRKEALWMYTNWAAFYTGDETILGTLEAGKYADMVILGGDFLTVPDNKISTLPIVATLVNGRFVYRQEDMLKNEGIALHR